MCLVKLQTNFPHFMSKFKCEIEMFSHSWHKERLKQQSDVCHGRPTVATAKHITTIDILYICTYTNTYACVCACVLQTFIVTRLPDAVPLAV